MLVMDLEGLVSEQLCRSHDSHARRVHRVAPFAASAIRRGILGQRPAVASVRGASGGREGALLREVGIEAGATDLAAPLLAGPDARAECVCAGAGRGDAPVTGIAGPVTLQLQARQRPGGMIARQRAYRHFWRDRCRMPCARTEPWPGRCT